MARFFVWMTFSALVLCACSEGKISDPKPSVSDSPSQGGSQNSGGDGDAAGSGSRDEATRSSASDAQSGGQSDLGPADVSTQSNNHTRDTAGDGSRAQSNDGDGDGDAAGDGDGDGHSGQSDDSGDGDSASSQSSRGPAGFDLEFRGLLDGDSTDWEHARDVAFDDEGAIYVVGGTSSNNFPTTDGAFDRTLAIGGQELGNHQPTDAFVTKIDKDGKIVWSTYLGSPNYDRAYAVEVDGGHNVFVAGRAGRGFPTTSGVLQPNFAGDSQAGAYGAQDGFIAKLSPDGSTLLWSTYFGDPGPAFIRDLAIDGQGRVHVGVSSVTDMDSRVTPNAAQSKRRGNYDTFYARVSPDGSKVEYGTYLGGNDTGGNYSSNPAVRVLPDGTAYVLTIEPGSGALTTPNAYQRDRAGDDDLLLANYTPDGNLVFCTYIGGSGAEKMDTHSLALDAQARPVIGLETRSSDYPVTDGSPVVNDSDIAVSIFSADGTKLLHSTRIGGDGYDGVEGISVDANGNVYISGFTSSSNLPVTPNALVSSYVGSLEGHMMVLSSDLSEHLFISYDGIPGEYANRSSMLSSSGRWAIVGAAWHLDPFPSTAGQDNRIDGEHAAFFQVLKPR